LALLELIRLKQLGATQTEAFGEIEISRVRPADQSANGSVGAAPQSETNSLST
jgi:hypothetical protein